MRALRGRERGQKERVGLSEGIYWKDCIFVWERKENESWVF